MGGRLCTLTTLLIVLGCAGIFPSLTSPTVIISNLRVKEVRPFETELLVHLRIINPSELPYTIEGIACTLSLNDRKFGAGVANTAQTVPAFGTALAPVVVYSSMIDLVRGFLKLSEQDHLSYRIKGSLRISTGDALPSSIPFSSEGTMNVQPLKDMRYTFSTMTTASTESTCNKRRRTHGLSTVA
jgi:LEA14-like dessication related protein